MDKDFMEYVHARIEKALTENSEYVRLQHECVEAQKNKDTELANDINERMESIAEELCYLKGFNDAMQLMKLK